MPPTPPSAHDDALDLDSLDLKQGKPSAKAAESDFEKELEALFAEELAASDEKHATAAPVGGPSSVEEDALLLDDLVEEPAAKASASASADDILDLGDFAAGEAMDLLPPDESPGGKDGAIDLGGLDMLLDGLGDKDKPAAKADSADELLDLSLDDLVDDMPQAASLDEPLTAATPAADAALLDLTLPDLSDPEPGRDLIAEQEMADMGGDLNLSLETPAAPAADGGDEADVSTLLETDDLGMGGIMEGIAAADEEPQPQPSLDPADLLAQIPDAPASHTDAAPAQNVYDVPVFASPADEPMMSFEPIAAQPAPAPLAEAVETAAKDEGPGLAGMALGALGLGAVAAAGAAAVSHFMGHDDKPAPTAAAPIMPAAAPAPAAPTAMAAPAAEPLAAPAGYAAAAPVAKPFLDDAALAGIKEQLEKLSAQVTGHSVTVMRLEGKLAEREAALKELDERLAASQAEAKTLRDELTGLRTQLESSLHAQNEDVKTVMDRSAQASADKAQAAMDKALAAVDKALAAMDKAQVASDKADALAPKVESSEMTVRGAGARLAQMEDRQARLEREVAAEIARAVPREAAKVIREEIAHLAATLGDD